MDYPDLNETLLHRLRLQTTPVAVKLAQSADEVPPKARRPHRTGVLGNLRDQRPRVVLPGAGDRIFSSTQDDELIFAVPAGQLATITDALGQAGHDKGIRYPVMTWLAFEPRPAEAWQRLAAFLEPA